jgi:HSP20 family protein
MARLLCDSALRTSNLGAAVARTPVRKPCAVKPLSRTSGADAHAIARLQGGTGVADVEGSGAMDAPQARRMNMAEISVQKKSGGQSPVLARREVDPLRLVREMLRWDPFQEMKPLWPAEGSAYAPAFEVRETKDAFVFKADLPGVKEGDVEVTTAGNRLTIGGKREEEKESKDDTYYACERSYGSFTRVFTLPEQADVEHVKAELKSGELTIVVPKTPAAVPKRIPVSGGDKPKV